MTTEMNGEVYYSTAETCSAVGVSRETLNRYVNEGHIRRYKQGLARTALYKREDVEELIRTRSTIREDQ